jgi:hypothetical protein
MTKLLIEKESNRNLVPGRGKVHLLCQAGFRPPLLPHSLFPMGSRGSSQRVKWTGREFDYSSPTTAEVRHDSS